MSNTIFKCQKITLLLIVYLLEAFSKPQDIKFDVTGYIQRKSGASFKIANYTEKEEKEKHITIFN